MYGLKRLDVTPLPFRVDRLESEARFSASARPGDDGQLAEREIEIDPLQVVLTRAANLDATAISGRGDALIFGLRSEATGDYPGAANRFATLARRAVREMRGDFLALRVEFRRQELLHRPEKFLLAREFLFPVGFFDRE